MDLPPGKSWWEERASIRVSSWSKIRRSRASEAFFREGGSDPGEDSPRDNGTDDGMVLSNRERCVHRFLRSRNCEKGRNASRNYGKKSHVWNLSASESIYLSVVGNSFVQTTRKNNSDGIGKEHFRPHLLLYRCSMRSSFKYKLPLAGWLGFVSFIQHWNPRNVVIAFSLKGFPKNIQRNVSFLGDELTFLIAHCHIELLFFLLKQIVPCVCHEKKRVKRWPKDHPKIVSPAPKNCHVNPEPFWMSSRN